MSNERSIEVVCSAPPADYLREKEEEGRKCTQ